MRHLQRLLFLLALTALPAGAEEHEFQYLIGRGMADITGPALGMQMWGFGRPDQVVEGIHIRQHARAFIIAEREVPDRRLVLVTADIGSIDHHIVLEVLDRLEPMYGNTYTLENLIISATHTHSGPGGYWHSRTDTGLDGGFYPALFEGVVAGVVDAIVAAHGDLAPGSVLINTGNVENAGVNRSQIAYLENPESERNRYGTDTNTRMTLIKFSRAEGDIGLLNWYALHPTAMNYYNRLISGDHKGYAALLMEEAMRGLAADKTNFVAAFAQSDPGDVSPNTNLDNTGPGATDVETTRIMGDRQITVARQLFTQADEALAGSIDTRQSYVNLSDYEVGAEFTGAGAQRTCPSAYGYSFAGGSTEDGGAHFLFWEGMTKQRAWRDWLIRTVTGAPKWTESVRACQEPKPILFETGTQEPPLQSQIRSFTIARIGQLVILALPAEVTTMAGRRLRESVMASVGDWAQHIVLAGYANGFAGYITTPEEYQLQQYEAAHTLHGPWSLPAYQQITTELAAALDAGDAVLNSASYDDWRGKSAELEIPRSAAPEPGVRQRLPGTALPLERTVYRNGDSVAVEFSSAHPNDAYPRHAMYIDVQRETANGWQTVASDDHWATRVRWREEGDSYFARLSWQVTDADAPGTYRIIHRGYDREGTAFEGVSGNFQVKTP